ncbi:D-arabinitol 2-dehydrogenase [ribulose-forming] [Exophiala dermatitidis]|uniref:Gluconate 5-dehydrogenase n=1 Tax=Exophiala dermatitidis (strain ATCC 34100 / CBS 525.76 / NIH/UT8656) TaxID=858893 RepID=H6BR36_EXODN|nr:gluconate 5-dehydrogenase [Exophiala dermatitidis NIH/UT8656]EHY54671.1 gluconate 5-dehydrogenase [Exophiala dermatitidis NIH/UT8656]
MFFRQSLRSSSALFAGYRVTGRKCTRTLRTLPQFSLENKTCVVTGSARGLGKEFLTAFALSGARGACVDLSLKDCESSISSISSHVQSTYPNESVPELRAYECNATIESDVKSTWARIVEDFGKVDVLVTAAGIVDNVEAENYDYARWRKMLDVNLDGTFLFAREAGQHMLKYNIQGSIILVASMSATICVRPQKQAAYNASKGAVQMLSKSLATEWGPRGIRVNSLSPGYMKTDLIKGLLEHEGKELVGSWEKDIPMGRMAEPHELQGTIVWMASDASSYLNGSDVVSHESGPESHYFCTTDYFCSRLLMEGILAGSDRGLERRSGVKGWEPMHFGYANDIQPILLQSKPLR